MQKFTSTGGFLGKWGTPGSGNGQFQSPRSIAVDEGSHVFVSDALNNRVQKFTSTGGFLLRKKDREGSAAALAEADRLNRMKVDRQAATFAVDLGKRRLGDGDVPGAVVSLREAVRLAPDLAEAHYQLALALDRQGASAEARRHFDEARRLAPYLRTPPRTAGRTTARPAPRP